ncbi:MAG: hypothetical protein ACR2ID_11420 [Chthoniobacterales bacterium]
MLQPARVHKIGATLFVIAVLLAAWKLIDDRMRPPPPPHPVGVQSGKPPV